ncbi:hypothetical protein [Caldisericum exile]|uniref:Uncharacterized protein n=1 Tax=Caldisericum exile (strain DSM 21853 / NBRC 104410 / AZM16c01) TaxID=511051 RepID=A0A7U6GD59_CALEA|nr:hypothetical protein [Caldisericum exile]BAL80199.1 hypothetical protein CSE_00730 [Caldisericum exile AZM16c01]
MDKEKMEKLMQKRSPITRGTVKPVDFFGSQLASQQAHKTVNQLSENLKVADETTTISKTETRLIKYTTYLPSELIVKIKIQAAMQKKKSYEIMQQALEKFFEKE